MTRINKYQLFTLIMLFQIGSATLVALGIRAKQDAWIAVLIATLVGFIWLSMYIKIQEFFPDKNLAEIIIILLGKTIGIPLVMLYVLYFLYMSNINLREFGELMLITILHRTPLIYLEIPFLLAMFYILFCGLHVLGRTSQLMLPIFLVSIFSVIILIKASGMVDLKELTPVLANGIKPPLKAVFPWLANFPFGEMVSFLMYWCHVDSKKDIRKVSFLAVGMDGLLFIITTVVIISVLGVEFASVATIPLLQVIKLINVADVITNVDALATVIIFIGGFYKTTINFYAGVLASSTVLKSINKKWSINVKWLMVIIGLFYLWCSTIIFPNFQYHLWLGAKVHSPYLHYVFQVPIPFLLLCIAWIRRKTNNKTTINFYAWVLASSTVLKSIKKK